MSALVYLFFVSKCVCVCVCVYNIYFLFFCPVDPQQVTLKKQVLRPFLSGHGFVGPLYVFMTRTLLLLVQMG